MTENKPELLLFSFFPPESDPRDQQKIKTSFHQYLWKEFVLK